MRGNDGIVPVISRIAYIFLSAGQISFDCEIIAQLVAVIFVLVATVIAFFLEIKDMYTIVKTAFSEWGYSSIYVLAMILLGTPI